MTLLNIHEADQWRALSFSPEQRIEAWEISVEQAPSLAAVGALEDRLHRRVDMLRNRERPCDVERQALSMCAARRVEIIAAVAIAPQPSAPGGNPATEKDC